MLISEIGEFELIAMLAQMLEQGHSSWGASHMGHLNLTIANGDDAAAWMPNDKYEVFTMDACVENVHFRSDFSSWYNIGWKSLASNISDVASMGAKPSYGLVTIGIPPTMQLEYLKEMYKGFSDISAYYQMMIVGGDLVKSENVFISISLVGGTDEAPVTRANATAGDSIILTGTVGSSKAGLLLLEQQLPNYTEDQSFLIDKHCKPYPHVEQGAVLATDKNVSAMDISDGLYGDLEKLCNNSKCGATIYVESIPVDQQLVTCFPEKYMQIALSGGEDYVLLSTVKPGMIETLKQSMDLWIIGEITEKQDGITVLLADGTKYNQDDFQGWDHFK